MRENSAIAVFGFCIGAVKYILSKGTEEVTTMETVLSGYVNLIMLSAISSVVPRRIRIAVIFIDIGCLSYNIYRKKKPPKYGGHSQEKRDVHTAADEELECASTE